METGATRLVAWAGAKLTCVFWSLFTFAHRIGYLQWNVAAAVTTPHVEDKLAQRIMTEDQVRRLLAALRNPRDNALLRLLYIAGLRISGRGYAMRWRHLTPRDGGELQLSIFGKAVDLARS